MNKLIKYFSLVILSVALTGCLSLFCRKETIFLLPETSQLTLPVNTSPEEIPVAMLKSAAKPKYLRSIHLTAWVAGSHKRRSQISEWLAQTELNGVVIAVKEYQGEVYVPGVEPVQQLRAYVSAIPDLENYLKVLKSNGVYTVARIVVFKDNIAARRRPEWAVKNAAGDIWRDNGGNSWLDPYSPAVWDYNLTIAERCAELGFDEIQFDYVRFPSDGNIRNCRYTQWHSTTTAVECIAQFLAAAKTRLKTKYPVNISADVFGLTTTPGNDMGIGQMLVEIAKQVDFVCPMLYPSHYNRGEFGIPEPNLQPYKTVYRSLQNAVKVLGPDAAKLRPYYQDFSLGCPYGAAEVSAQIQAGYDNNVAEWILWSPNVNYHALAFKGKSFSDIYQQSGEAKKIELLNSRIAAPLVKIKPANQETNPALEQKSETEKSGETSTVDKVKSYLKNALGSFWKK